MNIRALLLTAICLALSAGMPAQGETYQAQRQSLAAIAPTLGVGQSEDLASLAADLARTAARLADIQNNQQSESQYRSTPTQRTGQSFSNVEAARQFNSPSSKSGTTVRWLGSSASSNYQNYSRQGKTQEVVSHEYRRDQPLRRLPTAEAETRSQVIRAQANGEVFYQAQALQQGSGTRPNLPAAENSTDSADGNNPNTNPNPEPTPNWGQPVLVNDTCCGPSCDVVGCQTCRQPRKRIIVMGTEAVFLSPDLNGARSSFVFDDFANSSQFTYAPGSASAKGADLDDFYIAPRLWLGVQGECWGVVGRYFHLRAGENAYDPYIPASLDQGFDVHSAFEAYYTDLELTRNFCLNGIKNQFSFGVRYALFEHDESVIAMAEVPEGLINGGARSNRQAHGTGITFGLNGRKPLFCNSCAHWFYNIRSSVLWGSVNNSVETWSETILSDPNATAIAGSKDGAIAAVDDDIFIGEVQLGLEWNFAMRCLPAKSFFRMAFEYQYWDASRGRAASTSFSGFEVNNVATAQGTAFADAPGLRVDLVGFSVGTGFTW